MAKSDAGGGCEQVGLGRGDIVDVCVRLYVVVCMWMFCIVNQIYS